MKGGPAVLADSRKEGLMKVEGSRSHGGEELTALHMMEAGDNSALLCIGDEALSERIARILHELDYQVMSAREPSAARSMLEFDPCSLIVLEERFGAAEASKNPVLLYLQGLTMVVRRRLFLCLLTDEAPTLDLMAAFCAGVNVIINVQEVEKMPVILDRVMRDHRAFYALFSEELGKKDTSPA